MMTKVHSVLSLKPRNGPLTPSTLFFFSFLKKKLFYPWGIQPNRALQSRGIIQAGPSTSNPDPTLPYLKYEKTHILFLAYFILSDIINQIAELKRGAEIIVCTPGRMIDMLAANSGIIMYNDAAQVFRLVSSSSSAISASKN